MSNSRFEFNAPISSAQSVNTIQSTTPKAIAENTSVTHHILIVDDSNRICSLLVTGIVTNCVEAGYDCQIIQSSELGMSKTLPINLSTMESPFGSNPETSKATYRSSNKPNFVVYTANSPRNAVPVLNLPGVYYLTIISDIMMPADTEVGLIGMLDEIVKLRMAVNLVFTSSEIQNRDYVVSLIKSGKAFFLEKGSAAWADLPNAMVHQTERFAFRPITPSDYDNGMLRRRLAETPVVAPEPTPRTLGQRLRRSLGMPKRVIGSLRRNLKI